MEEKEIAELLNSTIIVEQTRSSYGISKLQKATLKGLGLGKIGRSKELKVTPEVLGMINKVMHLIKFVNKSATK